MNLSSLINQFHNDLEVRIIFVFIFVFFDGLLEDIFIYFISLILSLIEWVEPLCVIKFIIIVDEDLEFFRT